MQASVDSSCVRSVEESKKGGGRLEFTPERAHALRMRFTAAELKAMGGPREQFEGVYPAASRALEILELCSKSWDASLEIIAYGRKVLLVALKDCLPNYMRRTAQMEGDEEEVGVPPQEKDELKHWFVCVGELAAAALRAAYAGGGLVKDYYNRAEVASMLGVDPEALRPLHDVVGAMMVGLVGERGLRYLEVLVTCEVYILRIMHEMREELVHADLIRVHAAILANKFVSMNLARFAFMSEVKGALSAKLVACGATLLVIKFWERAAPLPSQLATFFSLEKASVCAVEREMFAALDFDIMLQEEDLRLGHEFKFMQEMNDFDYIDRVDEEIRVAREKKNALDCLHEQTRADHMDHNNNNNGW